MIATISHTLSDLLIVFVTIAGMLGFMFIAVIIMGTFVLVCYKALIFICDKLNLR